MELKTSTPLLVVRESGTVAPLNSHRWWCDGSFNGSWWSDLHGHVACSGVNSSQSITGEVGGTDSRLQGAA